MADKRFVIIFDSRGFGTRYVLSNKNRWTTSKDVNEFSEFNDFDMAAKLCEHLPKPVNDRAAEVIGDFVVAELRSEMVELVQFDKMHFEPIIELEMD